MIEYIRTHICNIYDIFIILKFIDIIIKFLYFIINFCIVNFIFNCCKKIMQSLNNIQYFFKSKIKYQTLSSL
jgi:hypothetical protein